VARVELHEDDVAGHRPLDGAEERDGGKGGVPHSDVDQGEVADGNGVAALPVDEVELHAGMRSGTYYEGGGAPA
jgi:hypothetical protein